MTLYTIFHPTDLLRLELSRMIAVIITSFDSRFAVHLEW